MVKAISSNVAAYVTVDLFVKALRKLVIRKLKPNCSTLGGNSLKQFRFPWSRPTLSLANASTISFRATTSFEKEFANFLEKAPDVERFANCRRNSAL